MSMRARNPRVRHVRERLERRAHSSVANWVLLALAFPILASCGDGRDVPACSGDREPTLDRGAEISTKEAAALERAFQLGRLSWPVVAGVRAAEEASVPEWLSVIVRQVGTGTRRASPIHQDLAHRRLLGADVVLVCDDHGIEAVRLAFGELLQTVGVRRARRGTEVGVALEFAPAALQAEWDAAISDLARSDRSALDTMLRRLRPYPVSAYKEVLPRIAALDVPFVAVTIPGSDQGTAKRIAQWLGERRGDRQLYALYGANHVRGSTGGIEGGLQDLGLSVVTVVTSSLVLDELLYDMYGASVLTDWHEIGSSLLRMPPLARSRQSPYVVEVDDEIEPVLARWEAATWVKGLDLKLDPVVRIRLVDARTEFLLEACAHHDSRPQRLGGMLAIGRAKKLDPGLAGFRRFAASVAEILGDERASKVLR